MFTDRFIANLPSDSDEALDLICHIFLEAHQKVKPEERIRSYDAYVDALAFLEAFAKSRSVTLTLPKIENLDRKAGIDAIYSAFNNSKKNAAGRLQRSSYARSAARYAALLSSSFAYEFSQGDMGEMKGLIEELHEIIRNDTDMELHHKMRLLRRLEKLRSGLQGRVPDLDAFWGFAGDVNALLRVNKTDPTLLQRARRFGKIVWETQARAVGLPSGTPIRLLDREDNHK